MPNEPLALPQILAGLPDEADYDAVHAALMATERGRRFLTEYADRNRHVDTTMVVSAIARIEATLRGEGSPQADAAGDLMEIAAAIDRIKAALAAGTLSTPDVSAAIERLSDIAFMLHERPVEATLCDGLDAAIREISDATMRSESTVAGSREAAELVRALAGRVREMMTLSNASRGASQATGENGDATSGAGFFELATEDGETFAQAVAELAASLPTLADAPSEPAEAAPEPESGQGAQAPAAETVPSNDALLVADDAQLTATETEVPDDSAAPPQFTSPQSSAEVSLSEAVLSQAFSDDHFASANFSGAAPAREETESEQVLNEEPPSEAVLPAQDFSTDPVPGPQEDPADLFEPPPVPTTPVEAAAPVVADNPMPAEPPAEPPRAVPPPPAWAIPRPPGSDPLAAVRDLSEEELIALFS
jgi:chemotaxis protein CheZ